MTSAYCGLQVRQRARAAVLSQRQSITSLGQLMPAANRAPLRSRAPLLPAAQLDGQLTHCWCIASWKLQLLAPQGARGRGVTEPDRRPARPTDAASRSRASGPPCSDPAPDTALSSANAALTCKIFEFFDDSFPMKLTDFGGGSNRKTVLI
jgi:hypothetical protein